MERSKITSAEIRKLFPDSVDKLLFAKSWTLPTNEEIDVAVAECVSERNWRRSSDPRVVVDKIDCARNVITAAAMMCEFDWPVALVQIPGHAVLWVMNDKRQQRFIEMLDGKDIDQELNPNLIFMV